MKKKLLIPLLGLLLLSACSKKAEQKPKIALPSAQSILVKTSKTNFKTMHAIWQQTNSSGQVLQKTTAKYSKSPLVLYANFTTDSNHYQLWIKGKHSYVKMEGTASEKWFKTSLSKSSSYSNLTGDAAKIALMSFTSDAKLFKVAKNNKGYRLTYNGNSQKIWQDISDNQVITSVIGLDLNEVKPKSSKITIDTDSKSNLTSLKIDSKYSESGQIKHLQFTADQINQLPPLSVPKKVLASAVVLSD